MAKERQYTAQHEVVIGKHKIPKVSKEELEFAKIGGSIIKLILILLFLAYLVAMWVIV